VVVALTIFDLLVFFTEALVVFVSSQHPALSIGQFSVDFTEVIEAFFPSIQQLVFDAVEDLLFSPSCARAKVRERIIARARRTKRYFMLSP